MPKHITSTLRAALSRRLALTMSVGVLLGVPTVLPAVASPASAATASSAPAASSLETQPGWASGVYCEGLDPKCAVNFGTWRGRAPDVVESFLSGSTWADIGAPGWWSWAWRYSPNVKSMIVTVPMLPSAQKSTLAAGARGDYDKYFVTTARSLVDAGMGNAWIRPGHEFNATWSRWYAGKNPADYASYFRHIVTAMRSVPGANFKFDWNVASGNQGMDATLAYPGDAYVDAIGQDVYDQNWGATLTPQARFAQIVQPTSGKFRQGLQFWADFATAHGKPLTYAEWGLVGHGSSMANGGAGGDDPYFITAMHNWFTTHNTAFEVYFNTNPADGHHVINKGEFPIAAATYRTTFAPLAPVVAGNVSGLKPVVVASVQSSRSGSKSLNGLTAKGKIFVSADISGGATVTFYLDDVARARAPYRIERAAPYDMDGTAANGSSGALDTSQLSVGNHTITATVKAGGVTTSQTATFRVTR
jgi:hypothetical protein